MTNEEKLQKLIEFLEENGIKYKKGHTSKMNNLHIKGYNINVHISDEDDNRFFLKMKPANPVFIREDDTAEFVIEKVQNTIIRVLTLRQRAYNKLKEKEAKNLQSETQK